MATRHLPDSLGPWRSPPLFLVSASSLHLGNISASPLGPAMRTFGSSFHFCFSYRRLLFGCLAIAFFLPPLTFLMGVACSNALVWGSLNRTSQSSTEKAPISKGVLVVKFSLGLDRSREQEGEEGRGSTTAARQHCLLRGGRGFYDWARPVHRFDDVWMNKRCVASWPCIGGHGSGM